MLESDWAKYTYRSCITCKHVLLDANANPCSCCSNNNASMFLKWEAE